MNATHIYRVFSKRSIEIWMLKDSLNIYIMCVCVCVCVCVYICICICICIHTHLSGFPGAASGKEPSCQCRRHRKCEFSPWVGKISWRRVWQPTSVFLPGESHGQNSLVGYGLSGCKESDTTEVT